MKYIKIIGFLFIIMAVYSCNKTDTSSGPKSTTPSTSGNPFDPNNPSNCLAVDTDGDGLIDCLDPDIDGDGKLNEVDAFPYDATEWADTDGDHVGNNSDAFPLDSTEWADTDNDGIGNNIDEDDDNDGVPDLWESIGFDLNNTEYFDADNDGIGDNADEDDDNDGIPDLWDAQKWNANVSFDIDHDGTDNSQDSDIDGDHFANLVDAFPYDATEWLDTDHDGVGNNIDPDIDGDGFPNDWEDFPLDAAYQFDTDHDGVANELDAFPYDSTEWVDTDGDGVGDNSDAFPLDPSAQYDTDHDGIADNLDIDADNDGHRNCVPINTTIVATCNQDAFPTDPLEWDDTDNDGIGNNADEDDDNDGIPDLWDKYTLDKLYWTDFDNDGIPDLQFPETLAQQALLPAGHVAFTIDEDFDNDGVPNLWDAFPYNANEWTDIDHDRVGDNQDLDRDGDGYSDIIDRFPYDATEWADNDNDGVGDNADEDDDNDGVPDLWDALPKNQYGWSDLNKDGLPDQVSNDLDGDGYPNGSYSCLNFSPYKHVGLTTITYQMMAKVNKYNSADAVYMPDCNLPENDPQYKCEMIPDTIHYTVCEFPEYRIDGSNGRRDLFIWDSTEWADNDQDLIPDNIDEDDDNDGVPDLWDKFANEDVSLKSFSWADNDNNGIPDSKYYFDTVNLIWKDLFETDIDGDNEIQGPFSCSGSPLKCEFQKNHCDNVPNPSYGIGTQPQYLNICFEYDAFPYNNQTKYDTDSDRIADNLDTDIDGDGKINCLPVDISSADACNQDQLPETGKFDPFVNAVYQIFSGTTVIQEIGYCANQTDCWYKNYDRDNDGLTDYQEYLNQTNPLSADTDGDGVPDAVEIAQGTKPMFANSFLDTDGDGVPDYLDKTPLGANDEASLISQIESSSTCRDKIDSTTCNANTLGLCSWNGATNKCDANEILITQNIDLKHCINVDGEVKIRGVNKYEINIHDEINNDSVNCDLLNVIPINGTANSKITLKNLSFKSINNAKTLVKSLGSFLRLDDLAVYMSGFKMPQFVNYENVINGDYQQYKTSINLKLSTSGETSVFENNGELINAKLINLSSNVVDCAGLDRTNEMSNYNCIKTQSETAVFNYNFISIDTGFAGTPLLPNYALNHTGSVSTAFTGMNYLSSAYKSMKVTSPGITYTAANLFTFDLLNNVSPVKTCINCSSTDNVTVSLGFNPGNNVFDSKNNLGLYCSSNEKTTASNQSIHYLYLDSTPVVAGLNSQNLQIFNTASVEYNKNTGLSYIGGFNNSIDLSYWYPYLNPDGSVFPSAVVSYNSVDGNIILPSNNGSVGVVGRYFTVNSSLTKKYKLSFKPKALNTSDIDIVLDVLVFDKGTGAMIANYKVNYKPTGSTIANSYNPTTGITTYYVNYDTEFVEVPFQPTTSNIIGVRINNNFSNISKDVSIDELSLKEGVIYPIQYAGSSKKICE